MGRLNETCLRGGEVEVWSGFFRLRTPLGITQRDHVTLPASKSVFKALADYDCCEKHQSWSADPVKNQNIVWNNGKGRVGVWSPKESAVDKVWIGLRLPLCEGGSRLIFPFYRLNDSLWGPHIFQRLIFHCRNIRKYKIVVKIVIFKHLV